MQGFQRSYRYISCCYNSQILSNFLKFVFELRDTVNFVEINFDFCEQVTNKYVNYKTLKHLYI